MQKEYNVNIMTNNGGYPEGPDTLRCGCVSANKINKCLDKIHDFGFVPETSCVYDINAQFSDVTTRCVSLSYNDSSAEKSTENHVGELSVFLRMRGGRRCPRFVCFRNIETGKCTDPFVVQVIGKHFFPDQYKNKNTKQR